MCIVVIHHFEAVLYELECGPECYTIARYATICKVLVLLNLYIQHKKLPQFTGKQKSPKIVLTDFLAPIDKFEVSFDSK